MDLDRSIREGHYARKQIYCRDPLISWSHRRRFEVGLQLAQEFSGKRILDYGCGDGTFLAMLVASSSAPLVAVGAETHDSLIEDCRARLSNRPGLSFVLTDELAAPEHLGAYDVVICMEVLEHLLDVEPVIERLIRLVAPTGKLVISVPVETGLPLIVKQVVRQIAGWRRVGDYPGTTPYTISEYWASVLAGCRQHIQRPIHRGNAGSSFYDHKGFNWMALRETLAQRCLIERTVSSPLTWLPATLATQVWFLASRKPDGTLKAV